MLRNPDSPAVQWFRPIVLLVTLLVAGLVFWLWWRDEGSQEVDPGEEALEPWDQPASRPLPGIEAAEPEGRADPADPTAMTADPRRLAGSPPSPGPR